MPKNPRICSKIPEYAQKSQNMPKNPRICSKIPEYAQKSQNMPKNPKIYIGIFAHFFLKSACSNE